MNLCQMKKKVKTWLFEAGSAPLSELSRLMDTKLTATAFQVREADGFKSHQFQSGNVYFFSFKTSLNYHSHY